MIGVQKCATWQSRASTHHSWKYIAKSNETHSSWSISRYSCETREKSGTDRKFHLREWHLSQTSSKSHSQFTNDEEQCNSGLAITPEALMNIVRYGGRMPLMVDRSTRPILPHCSAIGINA